MSYSVQFMATRALYMKLKMWRVRSGGTQTCATAAWTFIYDYEQNGAQRCSLSRKRECRASSEENPDWPGGAWSLIHIPSITVHCPPLRLVHNTLNQQDGSRLEKI